MDTDSTYSKCVGCGASRFASPACPKCGGTVMKLCDPRQSHRPPPPNAYWQVLRLRTPGDITTAVLPIRSEIMPMLAYWDGGSWQANQSLELGSGAVFPDHIVRTGARWVAIPIPQALDAWRCIEVVLR